MKSASRTVLSVFSGAGGLDLGLEAAGFTHLGLIEKCSLCRQTLARNRPQWKQLPWDDVHGAADHCNPSVFNLRPGDLDLLAGAPPCQPFSTAAQWSSKSRLGFADARADTLLAFLGLARRFLPKIILLENVPSFWGKKFGTESVIRNFFEDIEIQTGISYNIATAVLNAADYGVPQVRRRFILVATRAKKEFLWPKGSFQERPITAWDVLHSVAPEKKPKCSGKWAGLLQSIPEGWNYVWHTSRGDGLNLFGYRTRYWSFLLKLARNEPAWTIAAQPGPSTGPFHWEGRPLATEELLALQTFPQHWKLYGSHRDHVRMIGNATPPLLAECLGRTLQHQFFNSPSATKLKYLPSRTRIKPSATKLAKVPKKYQRLIRSHPPHPGTGKGPRPRVTQQMS
jgi:DNA (cytosine-5)-methyltransferase 1